MSFQDFNNETLMVLGFAALLLIFLLVLIIVTIKVLKGGSDSEEDELLEKKTKKKKNKKSKDSDDFDEDLEFNAEEVTNDEDESEDDDSEDESESEDEEKFEDEEDLDESELDENERMIREAKALVEKAKQEAAAKIRGVDDEDSTIEKGPTETTSKLNTTLIEEALEKTRNSSELTAESDKSIENARQRAESPNYDASFDSAFVDKPSIDNEKIDPIIPNPTVESMVSEETNEEEKEDRKSIAELGSEVNLENQSETDVIKETEDTSSVPTGTMASRLSARASEVIAETEEDDEDDYDDELYLDDEDDYDENIQDSDAEYEDDIDDSEEELDESEIDELLNEAGAVDAFEMGRRFAEERKAYEEEYNSLDEISDIELSDLNIGTHDGKITVNPVNVVKEASQTDKARVQEFLTEKPIPDRRRSKSRRKKDDTEEPTVIGAGRTLSKSFWYNTQDIEGLKRKEDMYFYCHYFENPNEAILPLITEMYDCGFVRTERIQKIAYGINFHSMDMKEILQRKEPVGVNMNEATKEPTEEDKELIYREWCKYVDRFRKIIVFNSKDDVENYIVQKLYEYGTGDVEKLLHSPM